MPNYMLSVGNSFKHKDKYTLKVKGWRKIYYAAQKGRKSRKPTLISDRRYFRLGRVLREKQGHYDKKVNSPR